MKKVGITTFYNACNYGAFLQTFALEKALEDRYEVSNIMYTCPEIKRQYRLIKTNNLKKFIKSLVFLPQNIKRQKKFNICIDKYLSLKGLNEKFDCVIAGSDQIWNFKLTGGYNKVYSLEYFSNIKKISYASSVGDESLILKNKESYKKILENIDKVSIREESTRKEFEKISEKEIKVNLDPTLLLTREKWEEYLREDDIKKPYLFSYFVAVTQENYEVLELLTKKSKLKTISYSENPKEKNSLKHCFCDDPFEFISRIKHAEMVFVSSFHGTVFSVIFNKPFFCMPPQDKASRIVNLLDKLDLSDRIINSKDEVEELDLRKEIDWEKVNKKLESLRKDSFEWLIKALEE